MATREKTVELVGQMWRDGLIRDWQFDPGKDRPVEGEVAVIIWVKADPE